MLVVTGDSLSLEFCDKCLQTALIAEAVVCFALVDQFLRVFQVDALLLALTLDIWTNAAVLVRTFVVLKSCFLQGAVDDVDSAFYLALLIRILDTQNKIATFMFCNQVCV